MPDGSENNEIRRVFKEIMMIHNAAGNGDRFLLPCVSISISCKTVWSPNILEQTGSLLFLHPLFEKVIFMFDPPKKKIAGKHVFGC